MALLVGLAAADDDLVPILGFLQVGDVESHQFGPAKCAWEAQQQQCAVAEAVPCLHVTPVSGAK
jgi:hypothetical protein